MSILAQECWMRDWWWLVGLRERDWRERIEDERERTKIGGRATNSGPDARMLRL